MLCALPGQVRPCSFTASNQCLKNHQLRNQPDLIVSAVFQVDSMLQIIIYDIFVSLDAIILDIVLLLISCFNRADIADL